MCAALTEARRGMDVTRDPGNGQYLEVPVIGTPLHVSS